MSWVSPLIGAAHIDYRGARFVLGRTSSEYAVWDSQVGGAPVETFPLSPEGWTSAWLSYEQKEGSSARSQVVAGPDASPTATWQRGRPLALQPMRVGQILDGAFKLYRMEFRTLVPLVAFVIVPFEVITLLLTLATLEPVSLPGGVTYEEPALWVTLGSASVQLFFVTPFLTAAVLRAAGDAYLGHGTRVATSYRAALRRVHSILWAQILMFLTVGVLFIPGVLAATSSRTVEALAGVAVILFLAALVPAMFFFLRWSFAPPSIVLEDLRGTSALRRSWRLARGLTGKIFGTVLLAWLILFGLLLVVGIIFGVIVGAFLFSSAQNPAFAGPGAGFYAINHSFNALVTILITPFPILVTVLLYFDARIRKEGFDLEIMARQLEGPAPSGA